MWEIQASWASRKMAFATNALTPVLPLGQVVKVTIGIQPTRLLSHWCFLGSGNGLRRIAARVEILGTHFYID